MFRKVFLVLLSTVLLNAASFNEKIANIIGYDVFNENKSLIEHLFTNEEKYYQNGSLNYISVMETLENNGLLNVTLNGPKEIRITFKISKDPIKSMKIVSDSLKRLGYYHYFTKNLVFDEEKSITWVINLKTGAAIDPLMLSKELAKNNCKFMDIKKEGYTEWVYEIDTSNSSLFKAKEIISGEELDLRKPLNPYFIKVSNANEISITSKAGNQWFPNVVFYDKHLNILNIIKENKESRFLKLEIPEETSYIKIDDIFTLANIKRGLRVMIKE